VTFVVSSEEEMQRLDARDLERVGRFVAETAAIEGDEPFPPAFLAAVQRLVPCDTVTFCELDRVRERELGTASFPDEPPEDVGLALDYWEARHEHPVCRFHESTGDWRAYRLSDFVEMRRFRSSRIYAEWFRPQHVESLITVGLDSPLSHTKVFLLARSAGRDFDEADCLVLDVLRPSLALRYEAARRPVACGSLTAREHQILTLVAEGKTNRHIADELSIAPGTVRRHLENAFAKLGVHTRTAAVRAAALGAFLTAAFSVA
jgi:DNA-binding CsgD family transcriptional regulator